MFAGSDCGGERAAAMYTLLGTAKLNGLDPELYLRTVLEQIADHPISRINAAAAMEPGSLTPDRLFSGRLRHTHQVPTKKQVDT